MSGDRQLASLATEHNFRPTCYPIYKHEGKLRIVPTPQSCDSVPLTDTSLCLQKIIGIYRSIARLFDRNIDGIIDYGNQILMGSPISNPPEDVKTISNLMDAMSHKPDKGNLFTRTFERCVPREGPTSDQLEHYSYIITAIVQTLEGIQRCVGGSSQIAKKFQEIQSKIKSITTQSFLEMRYKNSGRRRTGISMYEPWGYAINKKTLLLPDNTLDENERELMDLILKYWEETSLYVQSLNLPLQNMGDALREQFATVLNEFRERIHRVMEQTAPLSAEDLKLLLAINPKECKSLAKIMYADRESRGRWQALALLANSFVNRLNRTPDSKHIDGLELHSMGRDEQASTLHQIWIPRDKSRRGLDWTAIPEAIHRIHPAFPRHIYVSFAGIDNEGTAHALLSRDDATGNSFQWDQQVMSVEGDGNFII